MPFDETYADADLKRILTETRVVAVVGMTPDAARPDHFVPAIMQARGMRIIPVNPKYAGQEILGETVYGSLAEAGQALGDAIEMVDVFRRPAQVPPVVDEALQYLPGLKVIWMQVGIAHAEAAAQARAAGVDVVMNRCPKIEFARLF
ncbi:CoA-binding protein [Pseudooceanicola sediminis]|uniref:CoA-binding protein n=1 Tax=Pseudooceanicola sediminis TaxID=2211117 RepID=A0A399J5G4_9RHOB|nr:CoA-binding protein [Pseudooceanicola sediminis]KAA2312057.1 CoA-binding protein [Puniceibacterium sp. HSS470]RII38066.1 CoA-binding protein [Pseudooceanicola sediminis]|tara:strand:+ start:26507 stop:26947 length:441 start_codon:yes stop_codon:yes gene_type:complete